MSEFLVLRVITKLKLDANLDIAEHRKPQDGSFRKKFGKERIVDFGTDSTESVDYPEFCAAVARSVVAGDAEWGIVMGGSGQGEQLEDGRPGSEDEEQRRNSGNSLT